jgi:hypothetical protein
MNTINDSKPYQSNDGKAFADDQPSRSSHDQLSSALLRRVHRSFQSRASAGKHYARPGARSATWVIAPAARAGYRRSKYDDTNANAVRAWPEIGKWALPQGFSFAMPRSHCAECV